MDRPSYPVSIVVNGRPICEVVIDQHYKLKHADLNDARVLELVRKLDGGNFVPQEREGEWEFFVLDRIAHESKMYRLVWCMEDGALFIGMINAFRR